MKLNVDASTTRGNGDPGEAEIGVPGSDRSSDTCLSIPWRAALVRAVDSRRAPPLANAGRVSWLRRRTSHWVWNLRLGYRSSSAARGDIQGPAWPCVRNAVRGDGIPRRQSAGPPPATRGRLLIPARGLMDRRNWLIPRKRASVMHPLLPRGPRREDEDGHLLSGPPSNGRRVVDPVLMQASPGF